MIPNDILAHSEISALFCSHQRIFLLQHMATNLQTHRQTLCRETIGRETTELHYLGCLYERPLLRTHLTSGRRGRWFISQRRQRRLRKQDLINLSKVHTNSQSLNTIQRDYTGLHHILYIVASSLQFQVISKFKKSGSLFLGPSLGLFSCFPIQV